jgi:hypothetical protein
MTDALVPIDPLRPDYGVVDQITTMSDCKVQVLTFTNGKSAWQIVSPDGITLHISTPVDPPESPSPRCKNEGSYAGVRIFTDKGARTQCPTCGRQWLPEPWMDGGESPDHLPFHDAHDPFWTQPAPGTKQEAWA